MQANSTLAIEATGLVKAFGDDARRRRRRPGRAAAARSTACSARTAPARRRRSGCSRRCCAPTPARRGCSATTSSREADAVRGLVSLTGQLASVDEDLTGRENLILLGRLLGLQARRRPRRGRPSCSRRSGSPTRPAGWSRTTPAACGAGSTSPRASSSRRELMFLDEPTTGPRPALAQPGLGHHPRARRPRARRSCSAPSTSTRPTSSPTGSP